MTTTVGPRQFTSGCNGASVSFPCPNFKRQTDVGVFLLNSRFQRNEDGTRLILGTHYSITGSGEDGSARLATVDTFPSGYFIRAYRTSSREQAAEYEPDGGFPWAANEFELDRLTMVDEELADDKSDLEGRALRVGFGEAFDEMPHLFELADHYLNFDRDGQPVPGISSAAIAQLLLVSTALTTPVDGYIRPEDYGGTGGGVVNDNAAMQTLATTISNANGGGAALMPKRLYLVGAQDNHALAPTQSDGTGVGNYRYTAQDILHFAFADGFSFHGNGATLKVQPGLKHGAFNADETPMASADGYQGVGAASAFGALLFVENCNNFTIDGLIIDGNADALTKGGPWGDTGWQVGGTGLQLNNCTNYIISNVRVTGCPSDGLQLAGACDGAAALGENGLFLNCIFELNGRQGLSLIGGKDITFKLCSFSFNGKASRVDPNAAHTFRSNPCSGVDVECEGFREAHVINYEQCVFACNAGAAWLYAGGGASRHHFTDCVFIGDVNYALYKAAVMAGVRFTRCLVVGLSLWQGGGGDDPTQWVDVRVLDSDAMSPTGQAYDAGPIMDFGGSATGSVMERVKFLLTGAAYAPVAATGVIYRDTTLSQAAATVASIGGKFEGNNDWTAPNFSVGDLHSYSSSSGNISGRLTVNGAEISVLAPLANFNGLRARGYDGATQYNVRIVRWHDPVDWAANVGGANKFDLVISTGGVGGALMWECQTAPGDTLAKWERSGIKGSKQVILPGALALADPVGTTNDRYNQLLIALQDAGIGV